MSTSAQHFFSAFLPLGLRREARSSGAILAQPLRTRLLSPIFARMEGPRKLTKREAGSLGGLESVRRSRAATAERDKAIAAATGTLREVAARFGVSHELVRRIKRRLSAIAA